MDLPAKMSVVVPTYQRPVWIRRAVKSLAAQTHPPDEVVAIARDTDLPTHEAIAALQREALPFELRRELVVEPGFMPPVQLGLSVARGDLIAVMDDDAEAQPDWAERLRGHYADPSVGAVGGRCLNYSDELGPTPVPTTDRVGYVSWRGQFVGEMFCEPTFSEPVDVDFMLGGNMSYRREVARRIQFDMALNRSVAQGYEVDIGLQVRSMGWRILYDPRVVIRHYSAPRESVGLRMSDAESIKWYAFNQARVALRRLPQLRKSISLTYQLTIGERRAPGLVPLALGPVARRLGFDMAVARAALEGRLLAVRSVLEFH
jgi:GT2 family glycosyltransferase